MKAGDFSFTVSLIPGFLIIVLALCPLPASADIARDFNTGVYLYKKGDYDLAAKTFELILTKFPADERIDEVMFWYGESKFQLEKYQDALGIYRKLAAEHPKSKYTPKGLYSAGYAAMRLKRYGDAVEFFKEVASDPETDKDLVVECRILIADAYLKDGNDREAERALREVLDQPKLSAQRRQEAEFELGKLLIRVGRASEARSAFAKVAEKSGPHQADAFMALGDAAYADGKYRESLDWYDKIVRKVRGVPAAVKSRAQYNAAWSHVALNETERAMEKFKEVTEEKESPPEVRGDAALRMAYLHREKGAHKLASERAAEAEQIAEESSQPKLRDEVLLFRAESAFLAKKFDESLGFLARVVEKGYRILRLTGQIFYESGRPADAALYFERAAVAAPDRDAVNLCLFDMAQSHFAAQSFDTAVVALEKIKDPNDALENRIKPFRADALRQAGRFKDAARHYQRLADDGAVDTGVAQKYRYFSALSFFQAKQYGESSRMLDDYMATVPGLQESMISQGTGLGGLAGDSIFAGALLLRADVLTMQKKSSEAEVAYLRAIFAAETVGPDNLYLAYTHLLDFAVKYARDRMVDHIDDFVEEVPDTRSYAFVIDRLYDGEHYKALLRYTEDILRKFPATADLYGKAAYYQMMAYYKRQEISSADRSHGALSKWLAAHPSVELADEADFWRARIAQARPDRPLAKSAFLAYLDLHPTGKYVQDARYNIGLLALEDNLADEAEREFLKILAAKSDQEVLTQPMLADARYNLASVRILQGRFAEAQGILEPLGTVEPYKSDPAFLYKLGYVYVSLQRHAEGEEAFRRVLGMKRVPFGTMDNAVYALFSLMYRLERYDDLESDFKKYGTFIRDRTILARAKFLMGMTLFDSDRFGDAMPFFKAVKATTDTELEIEAAMRLGDCDYNLKRYKTALERYSRITEDYPATRWGREALYASGLCKIKLGFPEGALTGFERFLQESPDEPLALDVAREAARLYLRLGDVDASEQKLDFLEKRKVDGAFLEETMRMRVRIWQKRGDADKVLTLAKSHRGAYGPNSDVALAAAEAAIKLGRPQEAMDALDGFGTAAMDTNVRAFMDFYRAEALHKLGKDGAADLYKRLADFADTEIRLSSRFRYGVFLMDQKDFTAGREMFVSILTDPSGSLMSFYQDAILNAFSAAKQGNVPGEVPKLYAKYKSQIPDEKNKILLAEYNLWAQLALKDNSKSLTAIADLLALNLESRRRAEVLLISARLNDTLKDYAQADALYAGVMNNPGFPDDLRRDAEARKVQLAISRGAPGRPILEEYLEQGAKGEWASRAAEALLSSAVAENRHADIIRTVNMIETRLPAVSPAARYAAALAHLALSDTGAALVEFRKVVDAPSPETFYIAWSAYKVAQDEYLQRHLDGSKKYLQTAWTWRANLDTPAALNTYQQLAEVLLEGSDYAGMQALAGDPPPAGLTSEPHLLKGLAAWATGDFAGAVRHLKEEAALSLQFRMLYAESLKQSGDTAAAISEFEKIAEGVGPAAGRAQMQVAALNDAIGNLDGSLIAYYKILAVHESDTATDLGADALLAIARLYAKKGDLEKSRSTAQDLIKKYPNTRHSSEAAVLVGGQ